MSSNNTPFEIHVHGEVPLRADVTFEQLQEALKPLWKYSGAKSLVAAAESAYEEEPGIRFDANKHLLQMCWTVPGDEDFRQALDEMCMGLNDLAEAGAPIEVTFTMLILMMKMTTATRRKRATISLCILSALRPPPSCKYSATCWCRTRLA